MKTSTSHSLCSDENETGVGDGERQNEQSVLHIDANKNENYLIEADSYCRRRIPQALDDYDDCDSLSEGDSYSAGDDDEDEDRKQIGEGSNENDSFLVFSVAQKRDLKSSEYVDV